jgi:hypothetical protein
MTLIYGLAIAAGAVALLVLVGLGVNPDRGDIAPARRTAALGLLGFGLGGMSSSFAGWATALALLAAVAGAAVLILVGVRYGESST